MEELLREANKQILALKDEIKKKDLIIDALTKQLEELKKNLKQ